MTEPALPLSLPYDLATLSERGTELTLSPAPNELAAIAAWLGALGLERFTAALRLARAGDDTYDYAADFTADVVQACVVTLDPVRSHLAGEVKRRYRVTAKLRLKRRDQDPAVEPSAADDDTEILSTSEIDLAAPLLEELALVLDPYPRAPGVAFEPPKEERVPAESPFAVLAKLKERSAGAPATERATKAKPKS